MNSVRSDNTSLKYQRSTSSDCNDIGFRKLDFVGKTSPGVWKFNIENKGMFTKF